MIFNCIKQQNTSITKYFNYKLKIEEKRNLFLLFTLLVKLTFGNIIFGKNLESWRFFGRLLFKFNTFVNKFKKTRRRLLLCSEVDRARFTIHNTISAPNVSPHVPPPFTASTCGSRCEHLWSGTTNSFILPPMSTLATNAANV